MYEGNAPASTPIAQPDPPDGRDSDGYLPGSEVGYWRSWIEAEAERDRERWAAWTAEQASTVGGAA